jgi:CheY-like chemotaxis protein
LKVKSSSQISQADFAQHAPTDEQLWCRIQQRRAESAFVNKYTRRKDAEEVSPLIANIHQPSCLRPCMIVAYVDSALAVLCARHFRRLGWEVHLANSGPEARRLANRLAPQVLVLDTQLPDETSWQTCAKLALASGAKKVILVSPQVTEEECRLAEAAGAAALLARTTGVPQLVNQVVGVTPSAG